MKKRFTFVLLAALSCLMANAAVNSVDDLVGIYEPESSGSEYISASAWTALSSGHEVTISKNDDGTITINNLLNFGTSLVGSVDLDNKTITIAPSTFATYYILADTVSSSGNIVGKIDDAGVITFDNFNAWYNTWTYMYEPSVVLTKSNIAVEWSVEGTLSYYAGDDMTATPYRTAKTTLTKYSGAKYQYGLAMEGENASPAELRFSIYEDSLGISNGSQTAGYGGAYFYYVYDNNQSVWFDTSSGCTSFKGDKSAGEFYLYHYAYNTSTSSDADYTGYVVFKWDASTGISKTVISKSLENAPIFDLMGRKVVSPTAAGVYIQNGKKFIVK